MHAPDNEKRINSIKDPREQWLDDLLTADREHVQTAAEEQIANGMYRRVIQAQAEREHNTKPAWRWALASVGAALAIFMFWIVIPRKTAVSPTATAARPIHRPIATSVNTSVADTISRPAAKRRSNPRSVQIRASLYREQTIVPKQGTFPSNVVPTEEERLLMELARNHPEQLQEISEVLSEQEKQEKENSQSFEKWLRQGEQR